jgi:hypothetical protein
LPPPPKKPIIPPPPPPPPPRFHVHYDEALSSLQVPHYKGFCRLHITRSGDLEVYSLAMEKVGMGVVVGSPGNAQRCAT